VLLHHIRKLKTAFKDVPGPTDRHWLHGHLHLVMYISVILLMNSFNRTKAAVFSCRLRVLRDFPFNSLSQNILNGVLNLILGSIINKLSKKIISHWHSRLKHFTKRLRVRFLDLLAVHIYLRLFLKNTSVIKLSLWSVLDKVHIGFLYYLTNNNT